LNDSFGPECGDQALRLFSRVFRDFIRPNDDLLGYALMVNGIALHLHAKRRQPLAA
jgi:GGDEF domain-containing protein